ncbi:GntR family transcriptional regulator [Nonomuraea sp. NPDC048882]|uniref:GntR family transcriptional regulator n=1 Tax=Nonomuraea sp. NPDC048882 TaxID=3154347 RepID=UPI0033D55975
MNGERRVTADRTRTDAGGEPPEPDLGPQTVPSGGAGDVAVTTKADQIAQAIEELIIAGRLAPGTVLRQDELSRRFGVSRTPIREALRQLAAVGLVSFTPNRGVRVRALDRDEWTQTFLARAALEGAAAELAARRLTDAQLAELDAANAEFGRQTAVLRDPGAPAIERERASFAWIAANEDFHTTIIRAAGAPLFERLIAGLRRVFSGEALWAPGSPADRLYEINLRQHEAIRQALAVRNGPAARILVQDHIMDSWRLLQAVLDEPRA